MDARHYRVYSFPKPRSLSPGTCGTWRGFRRTIDDASDNLSRVGLSALLIGLPGSLAGFGTLPTPLLFGRWPARPAPTASQLGPQPDPNKSALNANQKQHATLPDIEAEPGRPGHQTNLDDPDVRERPRSRGTTTRAGGTIVISISSVGWHGENGPPVDAIHPTKVVLVPDNRSDFSTVPSRCIS